MQRKDRKFNKTPEWLYEQYVLKEKPRTEIAKECGVSEAGLKSVLIKYNIKKIPFVRPIKEIKQYLQEGKSVTEISKLLKCGKTTIYRVMKDSNLSINYTPDYKQYDSSKDELIISLYLEGYSSTEIAKALNSTHTTIIKHLKHNNIPIRSFVECQFNHLNKEIPKELISYKLLHQLYIIEHKSKKEIANSLNVDAGTINTALKKFNIHIRGNSESKIGLKCGENHHNWKNGITPLHLRLREAFGVQLTNQVLKRDGYKCTKCGTKGKLHVHHIRHFKDILWEIINEHPTLDIQKDVNTLYDIIVKDTRFLDLNNLITLCPNCHYEEHSKKHCFAENKRSELLENPEVDNQQPSINNNEGPETIPKGSTLK